MKPTAKLTLKDISKCRCGLVMRKEDWATHWRGCRVTGMLEVHPQDLKDLQVNDLAAK